jgi:hypothetical protein
MRNKRRQSGAGGAETLSEGMIHFRGRSQTVARLFMGRDTSESILLI